MEHLTTIDVWLALGVVAATAITDAVCVMFTSSIIHRKGLAVANWSALSYTLSSFAVISYTNNWGYVVFAALGSWIGAYITMKYLHAPVERRPVERVDREEHVAGASGDPVVGPPGDLVAALGPHRLPS